MSTNEQDFLKAAGVARSTQLEGKPMLPRDEYTLDVLNRLWNMQMAWRAAQFALETLSNFEHLRILATFRQSDWLAFYIEAFCSKVYGVHDRAIRLTRSVLQLPIEDHNLHTLPCMKKIRDTDLGRTLRRLLCDTEAVSKTRHFLAHEGDYIIQDATLLSLGAREDAIERHPEGTETGADSLRRDYVKYAADISKVLGAYFADLAAPFHDFTQQVFTAWRCQADKMTEDGIEQ